MSLCDHVYLFMYDLCIFTERIKAIYLCVLLQVFQGIDFPFIHALCILVSFTSVCINPVIYGLLNTNFKRDLRGICKPPEPRCSPTYCRCLRGNSRTLEQCGLISGLPQELSNSTNNKFRDVITSV